MATLHSFRVLSSLLVCSLSLLASGCGGNQSFERTLDQMWQWDGGVEASRVITRIQNQAAPEKVPGAVGVTGRGLVGRALPDGKLWKYEGEVDVLPTLVGNLVIFSGGGKVTALDIKSGKTLYSVNVHDRRLEGAGYDGTHSILLLVDKDDAREDEILVLGPSGQELFFAKANARLGTPAAIDGIGLVPYSGQYIGALDIATGKHLGRVLVRDGIHTVSSEKSGLLVYGAGATLLSGRVTSSPDSRSLKLAPRKLPGEPHWPLDGSKPRPARAQPIGIYAHAASTEETLKFSTGGYVATYYEVAVGFDHKTNKIRFSTHLPRAVSGGAAGKNGPTLCLENGTIFRVSSKTGNQVPFGALETKVKACAVTASDDAIPGGTPPPLLEQLEATIAGTGPDMVAIQKVLLRELGADDTVATTKALLAVAQNPLVSLDLAKAAHKLLAERKEGGNVMVEALKAGAPKPLQATTQEKPPAPALSSPETLEPAAPGPEEGSEWNESPEGGADEKTADVPTIDLDTRRREKLRPPPVGALASALARMKTPGAAQALAPYLNDPALSPKEVNALMSAVDELGTGDPIEMEHVARFLYQYKNTGGENQLIQALVRAAHFLFKHGDDEATQKLERDLGQSLTHPDLTKKLKASPRPAKPAKKGDKPPAETPEDATPPKK